ncbi:MAG: ribosome maturation factor RimM [Francisellaceae bacterium]|jgi:16S rRNA processing protein RimM|nr:ribosome maturation factor RimM [Francisellaceae bacterium]MBT6207961.1 ribosome maturation factor RimM [Francisellaceae bacterium]MBT6539900.1 ribosome maturation factor RimM [Francisellaceae bacterium]
MSVAAIEEKHVVIVGKIGAPHGVTGGMRLFSFTNPVTNILEFQDLRIAKANQTDKSAINWSSIVVKNIYQHKNGFVFSIDGIDDRDAAAALTHSSIAVLRNELDDLDNDEFYWDDLLGLQVYNQEDVYLGKVDSFMETGANDVIVIVDGKNEHLVPYLEQFILDIDLDEKKIRVDWDPNF